MRDVGDCLQQQRVRGRQPPIVLDIAPAYPGAKPNAAVADGNVAEPRNPAQIHQHTRGRQPEGKNRHQALPAGDHDCLGIRHEQVDCFPERGWGLVLEGSGFHPLASQIKLVRINVMAEIGEICAPTILVNSEGCRRKTVVRAERR
jgi:hypothetical protein